MIVDEKKRVLNDFLKNIFALSSLEYQERIWVLREGPECSDFTEAVCCFFSRADFILEHREDYGLTDDQHRLLVQLHAALETFSRDNDFPELFLHTEEWEKIREKAQDVLDAFHYKKEE